jgi:hypothetical protein
MPKLLVLLMLAVAFTSQSSDGPRAAADELLAADRAASAASARTTAVPGLTAMFAQDVIMQAPTVGFARGMAAATEALKANPDNLEGRVEWTPVRAGVSADGLHGFTFGFMTLRRPRVLDQARWTMAGGRIQAPPSSRWRGVVDGAGAVAAGQTRRAVNRRRRA